MTNLRFAHTLDELIDEVRALAAADPGFVYRAHYDDCRYFYDDKPACIMGRALFNLGYGNQFTQESTTIDQLLHERGVAGSPPKLSWLSRVQNAQDNSIDRNTWSEAVRLGDEYAVRNGYAAQTFEWLD